MIIGALACLIASMSWGAMFPVADHALEYIDPFYFSLIRYGAVAIMLIVLLLVKEGKQAFCLEGRGKLLVFLERWHLQYIMSSYFRANVNG